MKWRRRDTVPDDPKDWVGPIKDIRGPKFSTVRAVRTRLRRSTKNLTTSSTSSSPRFHPITTCTRGCGPDGTAWAVPSRSQKERQHEGAWGATRSSGRSQHRWAHTRLQLFCQGCSSVADLVSIRCAFFRPDRNKRRIMTLKLCVFCRTDQSTGLAVRQQDGRT